ncbi:MAG TPA: sporulation integral membrane protein YtvI [Bacillota bacterium]|nr:sporulation integral membrane protein YtvI [Bacillota bacterium]
MIRKITKRQWTIIILVLVAIIGYFLLPIAIPLIIALLTALALNPLVKWLQRKMKISRLFSVTIVFFLFLFLTGFVGTFLVTKAVAQVVNFVEDIPLHFNQLNQLYNKLVFDFQQFAQDLPPEFVRQLSMSIEENLLALSEVVKEKITLENVAQVFAKIPRYLISFLVYLIALFLFMLELPAIRTQLYNLLTDQTAEKVTFMNDRLSSVLLGFLKAQLLLSVIIFLASLIGLLIIAPDVAIIVSLIIWIIDLIPIIGSIIIMGPWALYMFLAGDTSMGIKLTILAIILLAIRRIVEPKVMGQHMGLSPLATLIAMFLGLKLLGVLGFVLGPLLIIIIKSAKEAEIIKWEFKI